MERLWSRAVATGGKAWQTATPRKRLEQAKTVATGCDQLPRNLDGKEGVDGSSPSEGSAKAPHVGAFLFGSTCVRANVRWVWSLIWSFQSEKSASPATA
jgi:hypothetical protein